MELSALLSCSRRILVDTRLLCTAMMLLVGGNSEAANTTTVLSPFPGTVVFAREYRRSH